MKKSQVLPLTMFVETLALQDRFTLFIILLNMFEEEKRLLAGGKEKILNQFTGYDPERGGIIIL